MNETAITEAQAFALIAAADRKRCADCGKGAELFEGRCWEHFRRYALTGSGAHAVVTNEGE